MRDLWHGRARPIPAILVAISASASACSGDASVSVDCNPEINFNGTDYRPHTDLKTEMVSTTSSIGDATILGCTEDGWEPIGTTTALEIEGVPVGTAISVRGEFAGIYVAKDIDPSEWPDAIRQDDPQTRDS